MRLVLGTMLVDARRRALLRQSDLAIRAGVSVDCIRRLERGAGSLTALQRVLSSLELTVAGLPPAASLGARCQHQRLARQFSQRDLARRAGVSVPALSRLEASSVGHVATLTAIVDALGCTLRLREAPAWNHRPGRGEWNTPSAIFAAIRGVLPRFDLDPCGAVDAHVPANQTYYIGDDGLRKPWTGRVWLNPPYSETGTWVRRACSAVERSEAELIVALLPVRTSTRYFHEAIAGHADILFLPERIRFEGASNSARFSSMLVVWGADRFLVENLQRALRASLWPCASHGERRHHL
jgi:phage N-6-adenine-methyltransferase